MNIEQEIRAQIEKNKGLKLAVSEINNHLSILEGLLRNERDDVQKQVEEAYQRGLDDAWEAARKIAQQWENDIDTEHRVVIDDSISITLDSMTASEAIEKLKAYEERQKVNEDVKRGDVVRSKVNGLTYIVTVASEGGYVLFRSDGNFATSCITNSFEKTGKHVNIDKILEEMKE